MAKRFDVVLAVFPCEDKVHVFEAPLYSELKPGDTVIVEDVNLSEHKATVIEVRTFNMDYDDAELEFLLKALGEELPLTRLKSQIVIEPFYYGKENEDE